MTLEGRVMEALHADDLRWDLDGGGPWRESQTVIETAIAALPAITDDLAAGVIVELLHTIVDLRERGQSIEQLVSVGLGEWHARHRADLRRQRLREHRRQHGKGRPC